MAKSSLWTDGTKWIHVLQTHEFWVLFFFYHFINVFAKNYVVINCLIELIRFIVYNVTTYIPANFKFLTNSTWVTKVFPTRWCTGASMGPQKPICHRNLWWILYFIYLYTNHFQETNTPQKIPFQNGGQWSILFRIISISAKIWKTTFTKEFSNGIWVKVLAENHIFPHLPNADLC